MTMTIPRETQGFFTIEFTESKLESWIDDLMLQTDIELENLYSLASYDVSAWRHMNSEDQELAYL